MLADLFYLSATWLILAFIALIAFGAKLRHSNFFTSLFYLLILIGMGDLITVGWWGGDPVLTVISSMVIIGVGIILLLVLRDWNAIGQVFFLVSITTTVMYLLYAFAVTAFSPTSPLAFIFSFLLFLLEAAALTLSLSYAFEALDVLCRVRWHHKVAPKPLGAYVPMVSLHVPAYNEPPELLEQTLRALAKLDYPSYEVILIDNNTPEEATWQPLVKVCQELGFKCLHLDHWPGYKSGALNFALAMTDPRAEIIAVVDADYIVEPQYLRRMVPYFEDDSIAFVQAPQDYRDQEASTFFQAAYDGYKYFFALSMPCRNEHNSIIFCGTMGLLRKKVMQEIGGWDEWCITEDAETSLRILNHGYKSLYIGETFGRGLMPLDFEGLKKQRFRWAFGGVQILKKHWPKLMPWAHWVDPANNRMSGVQRYFYLLGSLQWFNELLTFVFTIMVLISAVLTITNHTSFLRPTSEAFVVLPIVLIGTGLFRALWGLRHALSISWKRAFYALTLWFGLTWVVTMACVQALVQKGGVFLRTPKVLTNAAWLRALQISSWEAFLGIICILAGLGAIIYLPSLFTASLMLLCFVQALIYLSAPSHSLLSVSHRPGQPTEPDRANISGKVANEGRLGLQLSLAAVTALILVFVASLLPMPTQTPQWYSVYNPQPLIVPKSRPPLPIPQILPTSTPGSPTPQSTGPSPTINPLASPSLTLAAGASATPVPGASATPAPVASSTPAPAASSTPAPVATDTSAPAPPSATP
jgi:cellulose synthase/poly-beta-1,6-N-acetylglucosamine synthase-like glycosyltransferase